MIAVVFSPGISDNEKRSCGNFTPASNGAMTGGTITLHEYQMDDNGVVTPCAQLSPADTLAHELGHVLGLTDANSADCAGHIMGPRAGFGEPRTIFADDCSQVDALWNTEREQEAYCNMHCWTSCEGGVCPQQPISTVPIPCPTSPIIVDLDADGYHLVGLADAVYFDIDADGRPDRISWTAGSTEDAFLVMDRNGNGTIDHGRELFGTATQLSSGFTAPNGYEPLVEFDQPEFGGNGDALITAADSVWRRLKVWSDRNHDGRSDPGELQSLDAAGVTEFDTKYRRANKSDDYGNQFRFKSRAMVKNKRGKAKPEMTYDVFLCNRVERANCRLGETVTPLTDTTPA